MATITTINSGDLISNSRADINTNFANLNSDKIETSTLDTDTTLAANSDSKIPTQKAVKAYVDSGGNANASTTTRGIVEEATAAEVAAGTAVGGTGARLFINPSTAGAQFSGTTVYSAAAPTSFTDLNLSSIVGARQKMVMLKFIQGTATNIRLMVRTNGDTDSTLSSSTTGVNAGALVSNVGDSVNLIVQTDASGIIEWIAGSANTVTVKVISFW